MVKPLFSACVALLALAAACTPETEKQFWKALDESFGPKVKVSVEPPDLTPPVVSLEFVDPATQKKIVLKSGDPAMTVPIKKGDWLIVVVAAQDPQGVKAVTLYPSSHLDCEPVGDIGCAKFPSYAPYRIAIDAKQGDTVGTRLWFPWVVTASANACTPCGTRAVRIALWAEGENFSGVKGQASGLTFVAQ